MHKITLFISLLVLLLLTGCSQKPVKPVQMVENTNIPLPQTAKEALKLAHLLRDNGRYKASFDVYKNMDKKKELKGAYLLEYATVGSLVVEPSQVISLYNRADKALAEHQTREQREAICLGLGRAYLKVAQREKAEKYLNCALKVNPENVMALNAASVIAGYRGKAQKARALLEKALEIEPDNMMVLNNLAITYLLSEQYDRAIELLRAQESRLSFSARLNLALSYILNERTDMARELLNRYLRKPKAESVIQKFEVVRYRIENGHPIETELAALTQTPLTLSGDHS